MERLTKRIDGEAVFHECNGTCGTCDGVTCFCVQQMVSRLAAYEDTGFTPEEVKEHEEAYIEIMTRTYGQFHQKISQWLQAEKDGRMVVLSEEKELTDEEIAEMTGYKCPICKHHHLCTMPGMRAMCGESYTHFEPRKPREDEEALRKEADNG